MHWQELEPGPDLNRAVAERLGWSVRRIVPGRQVRYQLIRPDGSVEGTYNAERDAWMEVPSFSTRLDSALGLVEAADAELMLRRIPGVGWRAEIRHGNGVYTSGPDGEHLPDPAPVVVRAWLALQDQLTLPTGRES
ncbi:MAG: hypothetical protein WBH90_11090 [Aggregatilineales bacterium]|nr:hypothetical protein [Chloroflexota bacterium]HOA22791.1 hypothetical protein [Aggregatilineales bacterium]HPV07660.1 hypothetical protein [Aggregatilineales bacterium]HQE17658.1 hypothetical protein [Aggregatilineales bacterium]